MKNVIVVKVGNNERPAGPEDIKNVKKQFKKLKKKNASLSDFDIFVTHHAIEISIVDEEGSVRI